MLRRIIQINREKCNGCGLCAAACHEGAIGIVEGKAALLREDYCDGLGDCLPACPVGAITFEEREAPAYSAVRRTKAAPPCAESQKTSSLTNWPVQIRLAPVRAPYFDGADLLIAADCTAYAYGDFHGRFLRGRVALIGCPKLDACDYCEKLAQILIHNDIRSVTVTRMEVPCCGGLEYAVRRALQDSGKELPLEVVTLSIDGNILS